MIKIELNNYLNGKMPEIAEKLERYNEKHFFRERTIGFAGKEIVKKVINNLRSAIFPGVYESYPISEARVNILLGNNIRKAALDLSDIIQRALVNDCKRSEEEHEEGCTIYKDKAIQIVINLIEKLPAIREMLQTDIVAAYNGDPAAASLEEILLSYPSIEAVSIYRIAHFLYKQDVPLIPRIMTEIAHQKTGIDINPGAEIGEYFFVDHGTGVVIGETCRIGKNVKIYQGVTLGAKSFDLDKKGNPVKGLKRHPDIGDNVVIYSGATILGGDTVIGDNSVIGGNVWLTHSVPSNTTVYNSQPSPHIV